MGARADERIINGEDATSTAVAPYQVSLQQSGSHFCGGTVISSTHVMSAGHCKINGFLSRYTVALGGTDYRYLDQQLSMSIGLSIHNSPELTESTTITQSSLSAVPSPLPQELSKLPPSQQQVKNSLETPSSPDGERPRELESEATLSQPPSNG